MAKQRKTKPRPKKKLNAPQIFLLGALVGAVAALLIQLATNETSSDEIPGLIYSMQPIDQSRGVDKMFSRIRIDVDNLAAITPAEMSQPL